MRVTKKNAASIAEENKNSKTIVSSARTARAALVKDDVAEKTSLMVDVVSTPKALSILLEASLSKAKTVHIMEKSNMSVLYPGVEANTSTAKTRMAGVSMQKPRGTQEKAAGSNQKPRGEVNDET